MCLCGCLLSTCVRAMRIMLAGQGGSHVVGRLASAGFSFFFSDRRLGAISTGFHLPAVPVGLAANGRHLYTCAFMLGGLFIYV